MKVRSKRHHYVPQFLQRRFCDEFGKLWYAERNKSRLKSPAKRTPNGCFWGRNLNTTLNDGKPTDELEVGFWGEVDEYLSSILRYFDERFEIGLPPELSEESWRDFRAAISVLMRRSPDSSDIPNAMEIGATYKQRLNERSSVTGVDISGIDVSPIKLKQIGQDLIARTKAQLSDNILDALEPYKVCFAIPEKQHSFIFGSKNVYRAHNEGGTGHLSDPLTELFWPVSPKVCIVLVQMDSLKRPEIAMLPRNAVRSWNESICKESNCVASHSGKLLTSLVRSSPLPSRAK